MENTNLNNELMDTFVEMEDTAVAVSMELDILRNPTTSMLCTVKGDDHKTKIKVYNAITDPTKKMDDMVNVPFKLKDVIAHPVDLVSEKTGEVETMLRTILIDDKGNSYAGVSAGVVSALQRVFAIFGQPNTWAEPINVKLVKRDTRNGNKVTTLIIVQ